MKKISIVFLLVTMFAFFVINNPKVMAYNNRSDEGIIIKLQNAATDDNTTNDNLNTDNDATDNNTTDDNNDTLYDNNDTTNDDQNNIFSNLLYGVIGLLLGITITYLFTSTRKYK